MVHTTLQRLQQLLILPLLLFLCTSVSIDGGLVVLDAYALGSSSSRMTGGDYTKTRQQLVVQRWQRQRRQLSPSPPPCSLRDKYWYLNDMYGDRGTTELSSNFDRNNDQDPPPTTTSATVLYDTLSTSGRTEFESSPNSGNFFYNDEVISHLQGYMYLVGFFAGQDGLFVASFILWNSIGAYLTQTSQLPANPRIPAVIAVATFFTTILLRYGLSWDPVTEFLLATIQDYDGPNDAAWMYELGISVLNICWGFLGTWKTKQPASDGATYGF